MIGMSAQHNLPPLLPRAVQYRHFNLFDRPLTMRLRSLVYLHGISPIISCTAHNEASQATPLIRIRFFYRSPADQLQFDRFVIHLPIRHRRIAINQSCIAGLVLPLNHHHPPRDHLTIFGCSHKDGCTLHASCRQSNQSHHHHHQYGDQGHVFVSAAQRASARHH